MPLRQLTDVQGPMNPIRLTFAFSTAAAAAAIVQPAKAATCPPAQVRPAQDDDVVSWFAQGRQHMNRGEYKQASAYFERAVNRAPCVPTLIIALAKSLRAQKRLIEALKQYDSIRGMKLLPADKKSKIPKMIEDGWRKAISDAAIEAAEVQQVIPSFTLKLTEGGAANISVTVDGRALSANERKRPIRVNPGQSVEVIASAPGYAEDRKTFTLETGQKRVVKLALTASDWLDPQNQQEAERALYTAGMEHVSQRRWEQAADSFDKAAAVANGAQHLANAARAAVLAERFARARHLVIRAQAVAGSPPWLVQRLTAQLAQVKRRLGKFSVEVDRSGELSVDGQAVQLLDVGAGLELVPVDTAKKLDSGTYTLWLEAGTHRFELRTAKGVMSAEHSLAAEESRTVGLDEPGSGAPSWVAPVSYVTLAAGAVGTFVGVFFGLEAQQIRDDAEADDTLCPQRQCTGAGLQEIDRAKDKAGLSTVGFAIGVPLLAIGASLFFWDRSSRPKERPPTKAWIAPTFGKSAGGFSVGGTF